MGTWVNRAVTSVDVVDATLTAADLAPNSVAASELAAGAVSGAKMTSDARKKTFTYQVEDLAAGADLTGVVIFQTGSGGSTIITRTRIIFEQATTGVDGANTLTVALTGSAGVLSTTGALTANQSAGTVNDPAVGNATVTANSNITLDVTQGATANAGRMTIVVDYEVTT